ncbi:XRE family transcriptional regulator [Enterobacteriaceae bacterium C34A]
MSFSERLRQAMTVAGYTQGGLAKAVGMAQSSVNKLLKDADSSRKTVQIAQVLGVRPEWLSTGNGPMRSDANESNVGPESEWAGVEPWDSKTPLKDDEVEVPFLKDIEFACGSGRIAEEDHNGFMLRFSKSTLRRVGANTNGAGVLCFPATGSSMEPIIPDGTTVAVDTQNKRIVDGKLYAINHGGLKRIKQLYRLPNDMLSVRSYNKEEFEDQDVPMNEVEIIGRVFWYSVLL